MIFSQEHQKFWSTAQRVAFRFVFAYFLLFVFFTFYAEWFVKPIFWIGLRILKLDIQVHETLYSTGSGDTAFLFTTYLIVLIAASILAFFWSYLDRKRQSYNRLFYLFTFLLRAFLVLMMLQYGFEKIFKVQFRNASLLRLLQPLSDFSPMGLAWTYFGYSRVFNFFIGFAEVLGGLLLIPRRTQTLGALMIFGIMLHVTMMNFSYDVPVKMFALHITFFALLLAMTDLRRLLRVFVLNRFTDRINFYSPLPVKKYRIAKMIVKSVLAVGLLFYFGFYQFKAERRKGDKREKPPLYGIWETQHFLKNGDTLPPMITDENRWRYLVIDLKEKAAVKRMTDSITPYVFLADTVDQKISIFRKDNDSIDGNFQFSKQKDQLQLNGILEGDTIRAAFKKVDVSKMELYSRDFRWISEHPYNK